jgi:molecular chaperone GrpE
LSEETVDRELTENSEADQGLEAGAASGTVIEAEANQEEEQETESGEASPEEMLQEKLTAAEAQAAEYLDGWQRAKAEFDNARKRLQRERAESYTNAAVDYAKKLLPILDDFDRALDNVPPHIEEDGWFDGLVLVKRKLHSILDGLEVEPIEALGQPFDPSFHEALALQEIEGVESGLVIAELQAGYRRGDRVIRPALVNVAA